jgi:membrane-associated phospholipid phosphatase
MATPLNRRQFLETLRGVTAASLTAGVVSTPALAAAKPRHKQPSSALPTNGDEEAYPTKLASYTKGLPHTERGEVELPAYTAFLKALTTGKHADFEAVPLGGRVKFANPQAAYASTVEGLNLQSLALSAPPAFASAETAGEMVELYWHALTRDIPFAEYGTHALTTKAAAELSRLSDFRGPKENRVVTPATLFRGPTPGDVVGPYLSQFLWLDVQHGSMTLTQRNRVPVANEDYLRTYPEWLNVQRGFPPARVTRLDPTPRYLLTGRDLAEYVHRDYPYQAFLNACLILLALGAPLKGDYPYKKSLTQGGFVTFGPPDALDCVARVASPALKVSWYHKWLVHRRLRPEALSGRVHNHLTHVAEYPLHTDLLTATVLEDIARTTLSYLLPMSYPEGCPTHPAYPAGHAAIAGACATVLKAFFKETHELPTPVMASADGLSLVPYRGAPLTVGGELNKLASNISLGRDVAGVHYRSDGVEGLKLGEAVAMQVLRQLRTTYPEHFSGFRLTRFDGAEVVL